MNRTKSITLGFTLLAAILLSVSAIIRYFVLDPAEGNAILVEQGLVYYDMHYKPWNYILYLHILTAAVAIVIGPFQFIRKLRDRSIKLHKQLGKLYVSTIMVSGITGIYLSVYAFGGLLAKLGFMALSLSWIYATYQAYKYARGKRIELHIDWMYRSYAVSLVALSFRVWSGVIGYSTDNFKLGYVLAVWLGLIGNLLAAEILIRKRKAQKRH